MGSLGGTDRAQEFHSAAEPFGVCNTGQWKGVEGDRGGTLRPEQVTIKSFSQKFSDEICHDNSDEVVFVLNDEGAKSTSETHQSMGKHEGRRGLTGLNTSCPPYTVRLASSSPVTHKDNECAACQNL